MKAVMYHYVRPDSPVMPRLRYLRLEDFRRQLDYFSNTIGFVSRDEFLASIEDGVIRSNGALLTFDDGLTDHFEYVLPELVTRGLFGLFYVPTGIYLTKRMLSVHRIHFLLGRYAATEVLSALQAILTEEMLSHAHVEEFQKFPYSNQTNHQAADAVKRVLNYYISYDWRDTVLSLLMTHFIGDKEPAYVDAYYMTPDHLRKMQNLGMIVGSHSKSHPVFSKLDEAAQREEIEGSFGFLDNVIGGHSIRTFCYPYGGFYSFNAMTERILTEVGCRFSFNVEPRDIVTADLTSRPQALPRFDCNQFAHGKAAHD
jgi:peptidoglycan/xylan/chitin deacetylase (PgdA/CDA1 family)